MYPKLPLLILVVLCGCGCGREPEPPPASKPKPKPPALIFGSLNEDAAKIYDSVTWKKEHLSEAVSEYLPPNLADRPELDRALEEDKEGLSRLGRAARAVRCDWKPQRLDHFYDGPPIPGLLKGGKLLRGLIRRRMEQKRTEEAIEAFLVGMKVGTDYLRHPRLLEKLAGNIFIALMSDAFQSVTTPDSFDRLQLEFLDRHLAILPVAVPGAEKALMEERNCALASIDPLLNMGIWKAMQAIQGFTGPKTESDWHRKIDEILGKDRAASKEAISKSLNRVFSLMIEDARQPLNSREIRFNRDDFSNQITRGFTDWLLPENDDLSKGLPLASDAVTLLFAPMHLKFRENIALARFRIEALHAWVRLQRIGLEKGSFPESLGGLTGIAKDPFDGGSIKYVSRSGPNRKFFVLTSAWPGGDWKERVRELEEKCRFNLSSYRELSDTHDKAADMTWVGFLPASASVK